METVPGSPVRAGWAALAGVLALYAGLLWLRAPQERFGHYHDDTLYASAARAIAEGRGHIQPNLPGEPPATKYPPGFAYALAAAMLAFPAAGENPAHLWLLSAAAGALALSLAFVYLRQWRGVSWVWAAAAVALCAVRPAFLVTSGAVLSDVPFMALALGAFYAADRERGGWRSLVLAGALAGGAALTRTVGVAVVAGVVAALAARRDFRGSVAFLAGAAPLGLLALATKLAPAAVPAGASEGFRQTWLYYTDYTGFWRASVPDLETLAGMLYANLGSLIWAPAELCLGAAPASQSGKIGWAVATAAIASGIVRQARQDRWRPIHFGLLFTLPAVLLWNYEIAERLLLSFAPLFALGLCVEARHVVRGFLKTLRAGRAASERALAALALMLLAAAGALAANRTLQSHLAAAASRPPRSYDAQYAEIYAWLAENAQPGERFVAIDDGLLYLRTGRQGMWPLALTTEPSFRPDAARFEAQMALLPEAVRESGARYVIQTDHDYDFAPAMRQRWREWAAELPVLVENADGSARLLDLGGRMAQTPFP